MPTNSTDPYAALARFYDAATGRVLASPRRLIARHICAGSTPLPLKVLDIGCGTGMQMLEFGRCGLACAGVDASPAMLKRAERNLARAWPVAPPLPPLVLARADNLPFAPASFDVAVLSLLLHETEAPPFAVLDEALRVARRVLVMDWRMPERNLDYPLHLLVRLVERCAGGGHYRRFSNFMREGALEGLLGRYAAYRAGKGLPGGRVSFRQSLAGGLFLLLQVEGE